MRSCPKTETLAAWVRGELASERAGEVENHLSTCPRCAEEAANSTWHAALVKDLRAMERWRQNIAGALGALQDVEEHVSTTLSGPAAAMR